MTGNINSEFQIDCDSLVNYRFDFDWTSGTFGKIQDLLKNTIRGETVQNLSVQESTSE